MDYDPTQFLGSAPYYLRGRPPYSADLGDVLRDELGLDGTGHLVDVGSGPGTLGVQLASLFDQVTLVEPDPDMLAEAGRHAERAGVQAALVRATAEDLPRLGLGPLRAVSFGQSFHRTSRQEVAESVFDALEPGGHLVLVGHDATRPAPPAPPGVPRVPSGDVDALVREVGS